MTNIQDQYRQRLAANFVTAWKNFEGVCATFSHYGAADTEVREIMGKLLRDALNGKTVTYPRSRSGWGLYDVRGAGVAIQYLTVAARRVVQAGKRSPETAKGVFL